MARDLKVHLNVESSALAASFPKSQFHPHGATGTYNRSYGRGFSNRGRYNSRGNFRGRNYYRGVEQEVLLFLIMAAKLWHG